MRAVVVEEFGGPEGLAAVELPDPSPGSGQVLIEIEAIGVGGVDALIRSGGLGTYGFTSGHILGSEVAGTVTAVGAGADTAWVGRRVWAFTESGGYAEQVVSSTETLLALPEEVSVADAVTLGSSGLVAHFALRHAHFARGESVLVRGAAGGIGVSAVQLAVRAGASAVGVTTSSAQRGERLRELGATHVLDRSGRGAADAPAAYDVIVDIIAGPDLPQFFDQLAPNGRMVAVGAMGGWPPVDFGEEMIAGFKKSMTFATFSADSIPMPERQAVTAELFAAAGRGELKSVVHEVLPLDQAVVAHQRMAAGEVFGRIVLTPAR
ncbi:zinc-binding dehydrogenase [Nocardia macrotermitis]|uniref:2-haloacrylate reductase n=1 Tax=Nocardia macrotermitis TaxID=2585198 RepID=A0A7K0DCW6_9NOCA|nr:zinc-binding dehydrogenase [Nocardia macrotermitis]MQY23613.1 2-haloacrylate reductase [Nocardia macrotermitis]